MAAKKPEVPATADDPAESQRFIDMAREVEVDERPGAFDRAFTRVTRAKPQTQTRNGPGARRPSPGRGTA